MSCGSKEQKERVIVLNVDLDCEKCYKKVKKVLCEFPEIRNQEYDKKNNTVTITVLCCSPEKIRQKLCCKAGKFIKSIEIKTKEKPPEKSKEIPKNDSKKENGSKKGKPEQPPPPTAAKPPPACCPPCYKGRPRPPCYHIFLPGHPCPCGYYGPPCPPPCYGNRCGYFIEENPSSCSIM